MIARQWLGAVLGSLVACGVGTQESTPRTGECISTRHGIAVTHYHGAADKLGAQRREVELTPTAVAGRGLAVAWTSDEFDAAQLGGVEYPPHLYASPLYADDVEITTGAYAGSELSVAFAATSNGWVYAVNASETTEDCGIETGETLWSAQIAEPVVVEKLDGGMPMGILSTPVFDREHGRIYVAALDRVAGWQLHAVDAGSGASVPGWPVRLDASTVEAANTNGPARFWSPDTMSQRGALAMAADGTSVYVPFGTFWGEGAGWIVAVDTAAGSIAASFSSAPWAGGSANGGIWGSSGPTVAADGAVWLTTGNGPTDSGSAPGMWASSLLTLTADLRLQRVYTPANYCVLDEANLDLGASQPLLLPPQPGPSPALVAFGGKQGLVYLVDRDAMAVAGAGRPTCQRDMAGDTSLHPPGVQPQWDNPGPLPVFGPYSDKFGEIDHAKMRTKLAYHEDGSGRGWLLATGSSKRSEGSTQSVPPSIAKLRIETAGATTHLEVAVREPTITFANPGPPVVSSRDGRGAIAWVLDANAPRTASLVDPATPGPVLHAFDVRDLTPLWRSADGTLAQAGKYATPVVAHGQILVGSDRIVAFALRSADR